MDAEQKSALKEQTILAAARKRFAYYGYSKTTMDEIAGDIGMGKASLYYYFPTKESLYSAVIRKEQAEFISHAEQLITSDISASKKLVAYVERRLEYFRQAVNLTKLSIQSFTEIKPVFGNLFKDFAESELGFLRRILNDGKARGEFVFHDLEETALVLLHTFQGLRFRAMRSSPGEHLSETDIEGIRRESKVVVELLLHGMTSRPKEQSFVHSH
jgi:AcrR family transcriptional regulator